MSEEFEKSLIVTAAPDLLVEFDRMQPEIAYKLLDQEEPTDGIQHIETYARIISREDLPDVFSLTTYIEPVYEISYHDVARRLVDILPYSSSSLTSGEIAPSSDLGAVYIHNAQGHRALINPIFERDAWLVQSMIDGFNESSAEPDVIETVVYNHTIALNALAAAIEDRPYPESEPEEEYPSLTRLELRMPEQRKTEPMPDPFKNFVCIDSVIQQLKQVVKLADLDEETRRELEIEQIHTVLISGPSGVGKTALAKALGEALHAETLDIDLEDLCSEYVGKWAKNLAETFKEAMDSPHRILLFFDEIDGLFNAGNEGTQKNIDSTLKKKLEAIKDYPNVFVVMATNDESALPKEIRVKKRIPMTLRIDLPSAPERQNILRHLLVEAPLLLAGESIERSVSIMAAADSYDYKILVKESEDLSPGDIESALKSIKHHRVLSDEIDDIRRPFTQTEVVEAFRSLRKTREA